VWTPPLAWAAASLYTSLDTQWWENSYFDTVEYIQFECTSELCSLNGQNIIQYIIFIFFLTNSVNKLQFYMKKKKILDVFIGYPGSVHDARVFKESSLFQSLPELCSGKLYYIDCCSIILFNISINVKY